MTTATTTTTFEHGNNDNADNTNCESDEEHGPRERPRIRASIGASLCSTTEMGCMAGTRLQQLTRSAERTARYGWCP